MSSRQPQPDNGNTMKCIQTGNCSDYTFGSDLNLSIYVY